MAYSDNFPATRPVFMADFANGGKIDPRATFSRASTANVFDGAKHLSSENLITSSEGSAAWSGSATVTYNYTNGPDGVTGTALRLQSASGTERYRYSTGGPFTSGTAYTVSCWVKSNTGVAQTFRFMCSTTANQSGDLTTHATDWTRITATITPNATVVFAGFVFLSANTNDISVWGLQVNTGSSALDYQPTTTSIHREYASSLVSKANNIGRFEVGTDGQSGAKGLLVESQTTNLLPNGATGYNPSNSFSWNKVNANVVQNAAIAPTGQLEATHFYEDTATATQQRFDVTVTATAAAHTLSGYFKSAGRDEIIVRVANGGSNYWGKLTFSTETTSDAGNPFSSLSVTSAGNGWYRFTATTPTLTAGSTTVYINLSGGALNYDGDGYSGVLFYGLQFEANSFASSVIATSGGTATRAADSLSVDLTQAGFSGGPFTVVSETEGGLGAYPRAYALTNGTSSERLVVYKSSANATASTNWNVNGVTGGADTVLSSIPSSASAGKLAVSYDTNDVSFCASGGTVTTDTSAVIPSGLDTLKVGALWDGATNQLNGHCKRIALYNEALSDTNLQALTS